MPPEERVVCRFAAEPPQADAPTGAWAEALRREFLAAVEALETEGEELGEVGPLRFYPDRSWSDITYLPVTARTGGGFEVFGYVAYEHDEEGDPAELEAFADFTDELAERHPEWRMDLNEEVIGSWRGEAGRLAAMTLVWGTPLTEGGVVVTAELAGLTVDQCAVIADRFTLLAPDAYGTDYLEVALWNRDGGELARDSLYED